MSLVKRTNSPYWYAQFQINHQTFIRSTRTVDRKVAERMEAKFRTAAHEDLLLGKKKPQSIEAALAAYLRAREGTPNYGNLTSKRKTLLSYFSGNLPISSIANSDLENFRYTRSQSGVSNQTIKHGLNVLLGAIRFAKKLGYDAPDLQPPLLKLSQGQLRYLSLEEEKRLLDELDPHLERPGLAPTHQRTSSLLQAMQDNYDLVVLLLDTGARYSEIANMRWAQVDFDEGFIRLWRTKVSNESLIFLSDRAALVLDSRKDNPHSEFVFSNKQGSSRGYNVIALRKAFNRAGLKDCSVHTLRHTHASRLIQRGMSVYEVKTILGHADIRTTMRYAHLEQREVTSRARDLINAANRSTSFTLGDGSKRLLSV